MSESATQLPLEPKPLDYSRHYRHWHDDSDAHFEQVSRSEYRWIRSYLPRSRDAAILDIGCGMGFLVGAYVQHGGYTHVLGIDSSDDQLASALRRRLPVEKVATERTLEWLAARPGKFALISAIDVIEHVPVELQIAFVRALCNSLQEGGQLIARVPNANSTVGGRMRYLDWTHHSAFTEHSLDFLLFHGGYSQIQILDAGPAPSGRALLTPKGAALCFFRGLRRLEMFAELGTAGLRAPLGHNILAIATR